MVEAYIGGTGDAEKDYLLASKQAHKRLIINSLIVLIIIEIVTITQFVATTFLGIASPVHLTLSAVVLGACVGAAVILFVLRR